VFAESAVDERCRETQAFERAGCAGIAGLWFDAKEFFYSGVAAGCFVNLAFAHGGCGNVAIDAFANEFGDEARIANGFTSSGNVKLREEAIVEKIFRTTSFDSRADFVIGVAFAFEAAPKLRFG
jgi:hypothetical protein